MPHKFVSRTWETRVLWPPQNVLLHEFTTLILYFIQHFIRSHVVEAEVRLLREF